MMSINEPGKRPILARMHPITALYGRAIMFGRIDRHRIGSDRGQKDANQACPIRDGPGSQSRMKLERLRRIERPVLQIKDWVRCPR